MLMRALYDILWHAVLPYLPLRLWWRGRREPGYRAHIGERFGRYRRRAARQT
jgi:3-deoxy-D-manno-octulosonic-acid transferase